MIELHDFVLAVSRGEKYMYELFQTLIRKGIKISEQGEENETTTARILRRLLTKI